MSSWNLVGKSINGLFLQTLQHEGEKYALIQTMDLDTGSMHAKDEKASKKPPMLLVKLAKSRSEAYKQTMEIDFANTIWKGKDVNVLSLVNGSIKGDLNNKGGRKRSPQDILRAAEFISDQQRCNQNPHFPRLPVSGVWERGYYSLENSTYIFNHAIEDSIDNKVSSGVNSIVELARELEIYGKVDKATPKRQIDMDMDGAIDYALDQFDEFTQKHGKLIKVTLDNFVPIGAKANEPGKDIGNGYEHGLNGAVVTLQTDNGPVQIPVITGIAPVMRFDQKNDPLKLLGNARGKSEFTSDILAYAREDVRVSNNSIESDANMQLNVDVLTQVAAGERITIKDPQNQSHDLGSAFINLLKQADEFTQKPKANQGDNASLGFDKMSLVLDYRGGKTAKDSSSSEFKVDKYHDAYGLSSRFDFDPKSDTPPSEQILTELKKIIDGEYLLSAKKHDVHKALHALIIDHKDYIKQGVDKWLERNVDQKGSELYDEVKELSGSLLYVNPQTGSVGHDGLKYTALYRLMSKNPDLFAKVAYNANELANTNAAPQNLSTTPLAKLEELIIKATDLEKRHAESVMVISGIKRYLDRSMEAAIEQGIPFDKIPRLIELKRPDDYKRGDRTPYQLVLDPSKPLADPVNSIITGPRSPLSLAASDVIKDLRYEKKMVITVNDNFFKDYQRPENDFESKMSKVQANYKRLKESLGLSQQEGLRMAIFSPAGVSAYGAIADSIANEVLMPKVSKLALPAQIQQSEKTNVINNPIAVAGIYGVTDHPAKSAINGFLMNRTKQKDGVFRTLTRFVDSLESGKKTGLIKDLVKRIQPTMQPMSNALFQNTEKTFGNVREDGTIAQSSAVANVKDVASLGEGENFVSFDASKSLYSGGSIMYISGTQLVAQNMAYFLLASENAQNMAKTVHKDRGVPTLKIDYETVKDAAQTARNLKSLSAVETTRSASYYPVELQRDERGNFIPTTSGLVYGHDNPSEGISIVYQKGGDDRYNPKIKDQDGKTLDISNHFHHSEKIAELMVSDKHIAQELFSRFDRAVPATPNNSLDPSLAITIDMVVNANTGRGEYGHKGSEIEFRHIKQQGIEIKQEQHFDYSFNTPAVQQLDDIPSYDNLVTADYEDDMGFDSIVAEAQNRTGISKQLSESKTVPSKRNEDPSFGMR